MARKKKGLLEKNIYAPNGAGYLQWERDTQILDGLSILSSNFSVII